MRNEPMEDTMATVVGALAAIVLFLGVIVGGCATYPRYRVWQQGLEGQAALARAEQERQIQVTQATAELEAAQKKAEAIRIVGEAAKQFPEYRTQEFIQAFGEAVKSGAIDQVIYVPTEANIPITEAHRLASKPETR